MAQAGTEARCGVLSLGARSPGGGGGGLLGHGGDFGWLAQPPPGAALATGRTAF